MRKHENSVRFAICGQWTDGTEFNADPSWAPQHIKNIKGLVQRLEKPCPREFDEATNRHLECAKKVQYVEVVEYRSTCLASFGKPFSQE